MGRSRVLTTLTAVGVAIAFALGAGLAGAAPLPGGVAPVMNIHVDSSAGGYGYTANQPGTLQPDGTYDVIGNGYSSNGVFSVSWDLNVDPDPFVAGDLTLTNTSTDSQTFVITATLPATPMPGPNYMWGFFGDPTTGVRFIDQNNSTSVTLSTVGSNPFYQAIIDGGVVQNMGSFSLTAFGGPGVYGTVSRHSFGEPVGSLGAPPVNTSIGIRLEFELSAGDRVIVPVRFEVVPEPGVLVLLGLGLASLAAVRRARA